MLALIKSYKLILYFVNKILYSNTNLVKFPTDLVFNIKKTYKKILDSLLHIILNAYPDCIVVIVQALIVNKFIYLFTVIYISVQPKIN
jgi:hypothetical protein